MSKCVMWVSLLIYCASFSSFSEEICGTVKKVTGFRLLQVETDHGTSKVLLHCLKFQPPQSEAGKMASAFLKEKCLRQGVTAVVDYADGSQINGDVLLSDGSSCSILLLQHGLADCDSNASSYHPEYFDYVERAKASGLGMWVNSADGEPESQETTEAEIVVPLRSREAHFAAFAKQIEKLVWQLYCSEE